ncbi:MAG: hypothetical protein HGA37_17350 [Lentimicrobium sp.]|nr:hypothetical protein [Lentimicrobium sp.]
MNPIRPGFGLNSLFRCCYRHFPRLIFPGWFIVLLLCSCSKDNDSGPLSNEITIGNYKDMYVDGTVKTIDPPYNGYEEILLDFDKNDSADLRLLVVMYGSPGMGIRYMSEVQSLNKHTTFYGVYTTDTVFMNRVIGNFSDEYNNYQSITDYYSCRRKNTTDQIISIGNAFHALDLNKNDKLRLTDTFSAETVSFIYQWNSPLLDYFENDTVYRCSSYYEFDCHKMPFGQEIYIGFKFTHKVDHLGWIKIIVQSEANISLKEYAVQR